MNNFFYGSFHWNKNCCSKQNRISPHSLKQSTMKKITLFLIVTFLSVQTLAQITLEHTYDSAGYYFSSTIYQQLYVVKLEVDSDKFVFVDRVDKLIRLYNVNHTFWKSISFAAATDLNPNADAMSIMYITQHLFD